ncbi:polysaccharide biosynthesis/export family protein [Spirosoma telluris]|uniref:polysaccharide biosynthesis/export family protein n=1 Tax=Spirosoma telluris TaxID=2183553 RepID=UPI002FC37E0A
MATRLQRKIRVTLLLLLISIVGLTTQAQVAPTPGAGAAPASGLPGSIQAAPAKGGANQQGGNLNNLPANLQQQLNQRTGQGATNGRQGATNGRTATPGTTQSPTGNDFSQKGDTLDAGASEKEIAEQAVKRAQLREQAERRQKLFGYSLFNDPAMATTFQPNLNIATPRNYIVGPGDELNIQMYGYSVGDFSQKVSPEGYVYITGQSGIGPIFVSGLSVDKAKERLISRMSAKFVGLRNSSYGAQNTFLEVSLGNIRSIRVTVTGDAMRPGTYTMSGLSTVMNAIYQAGGPNDIGSFRKVQLIRNNRVVATLDLYDYLLSGIQHNDLRLQDNDNIRFTTYIQRAEINGAVKRSNIFEMLPGETMERLLFYAGDFTSNAYKSRVQVTRLTDRELKFMDVTVPEFKTFVMQDGDVVNIERLLNRFENKLTIEGAVYRPGEYSLDNNKTLKQLIASAEGLKGDAFTGVLPLAGHAKIWLWKIFPSTWPTLWLALNQTFRFNAKIRSSFHHVSNWLSRQLFR